MNCKNCQSKMQGIQQNSHGEYWVFWCEQCGMLFYLMTNRYPTDCPHKENYWHPPKSIENTKKLVNALIKAQDRKSAMADRLNRIAKDEADRVEWGEDERR